jgi:hypothetical protein
MPNPEHVAIFEQGAEIWNEWRSRHPEVIPDLSGAMLSGRWRERINLSGANLQTTWLDSAHLNNANLSDADLSFTILSFASLMGADFSRSRLYKTDLSLAHLSNAKFRGAALLITNLNNSILADADFSEAQFRGVVFGNNDLSTVNGLERVYHLGPSAADIQAIYHSQGRIPDAFLRGCGLPEDFITFARSVATQPIQFYSCFISYSSRDKEFAERLHADLQAKGVRVWFAPHDLPIGASIRPTTDESIRLHDKLLLVLSEASVSSQWVEQEVETALAKEREQVGRTVLFPIRIDDSVMESRAGWPALLRNTRNVGDFTRWKEHDSYQTAFERLLRDLKVGA